MLAGIVVFALALVIGAIISAPLTLRIFRSDVAFELAQMAAGNASLIKKEIAESPEQAQVDQLEAGITHWQQVQRGVVADEGDSAEVTALKSDLGAAQADLEESQHQFAQDAAWYNCERYGADRDKLAIAIGGVVITRDGEPVPDYDETPVVAHMKRQKIDIDVDVGIAKGKATVWTCDLTHGYIDINGSYRT